ncbi:fibronectin type III domain-containing protein [Cohnella suwonensis]|uniref:Fibronectin type III domain-containing protein n=1 Tax=Cohnella suwonensis TaxID=696072 RepID=A0ABW0M183_9BACL
MVKKKMLSVLLSLTIVASILGVNGFATNAYASPAAPTGLSHSNVTSSSWTATWNSVTSATYYNLYLDGAPTPWATGLTETSITVSGQQIQPNTTHTIQVTAADESGEGTLSNLDTVTTATLAPANLSHSTVTSTGWVETWPIVPGAISYNVYVNGTKVNASPITTSGQDPNATYAVTGQSPNTTYSVTVTAVNAAGVESAPSPVADSVLTAPGAPTGLSHSYVTSTGWTETWNAVSGATSYILLLNGIVESQGITGTSYVVTGKVPSIYSVQVIAVNSSGDQGDPSEADTLMTSVPSSAPTGLSHSNVTSYGWTSTWNAVPGASSYILYYNGQVYRRGIRATSYDVRLWDVNPISVTVAAANVLGVPGPQSAEDLVTTIPFPPAPPAPSKPPAPTGLKHSYTASGAWELTWNAVPGATSYHLCIDCDGTMPVTRMGGPDSRKIYDITGTSYKLVYGVPSKTYNVVVTAFNGSRESDASNLEVVGNLYEQPTQLKAYYNYLTRNAYITWRDIGYNAKYNVYLNGKKVQQSITTAEATLQDIMPDTAYSVYVTAVNSLGEESLPSSAKTIDTATPKYDALSYSNVTSTSFTVSWDKKQTVAVWFNKKGEAEDFLGYLENKSSRTYSNLEPNTEYIITVKNQYMARRAIVLTKPENPGSLNCENLTSSSCTLRWQNGNPGKVSFIVYVDGKKLNKVGDQSYPLKGLLPGKTYTAKVTAVNASGESGATIKTFTTLTSGPTGLSHSNVTSSGWTEKWSAIAGASSYNLYLNGSKVNKKPILGISYQIENVSMRTVHSVKVTAINSKGVESDYSPADSILTLLAAPKGVSHMNVTSSAWVEKWVSVKGAFSYNVYINGKKVNSKPIRDTYYYITNKSAGTKFEVQVTAVDVSGEGERSRVDYVKTLRNN